MKNLILFLVLSFCIISCIEVRDPEKKNQEVKNDVPTPKAEIFPLPQPQRYVVALSNLTEAEITRRSLGLLNQKPTMKTSAQTKAEDIIDQAGPYEYEVKQRGQTFLLQVEIPEDFVISGEMKLDQISFNIKKEGDFFRVLETDGRVFFKSGSVLKTYGENVLIKASLIESEGASLETFPENQKAASGQDGHHGGIIRLESQTLVGSLHFLMRGEIGGDGEDLSFLDRKKIDQIDNNGRNGGNSGQVQISIQDRSKGDISADLFPGVGGDGVTLVIPCLVQNCPSSVIKPKIMKGRSGIAQPLRFE